MRRLLFMIVAIAVYMLIAPGAALAKGASAATIDGPGAGPSGKIDIGGDPGAGEPGSGAMLDQLAAHAGIYAVGFGEPDARLVNERPEGKLGPKHTITWTVPQPDGSNGTVLQDLYPYADGGAVTHTSAGQRFFDSFETRQGWYVGGEGLSRVLADAGLSAESPATGMSPLIPVVAALLGAAALVALGVVVRRMTVARQSAANALAGS